MYGGEEVSSLIFDIGSFSFRVGYNGEDVPKSVLQPYIGTNKSMENDYFSCGENNLRYFKESTEIHNIVSKSGTIENFDLFEKFTDFIFEKELKVDTKEYPMLLSEPSQHYKENRMKLTEIMFEQYDVPGLFICKSAVLSAFSLGRSTALVLDSGHFNTYATPVHDGYALQKSLVKHEVGGQYLTNELSKLLESKNVKIYPHYKINKTFIDSQPFVDYLTDLKDHYSFENYWKQEIIRDMKENILSSVLVEENSQNKESLKQPLSYELPDGKIVEFKEERLSLIDKLFHPIKEQQGFSGLHQMVIDSINKSDVELKKEFYSNIIITGGNTLFSGLQEKIHKQIIGISIQGYKIKVCVPPSNAEKRFSSWIGGSILTSVANFNQMWMSKPEFEEHGAQLVERKCQ